MPYTLLDHTADIGISVQEETVEKAFSTACLAMYELMIPVFGISSEERIVEITAPDQERLLVEFLSELLYIFDVEGFVASHSVVSLKNGALRAVLRGGRFNPEEHDVDMQIKAVTYHALRVEDGLINVIFDI